tara:strand:- start:4882 stop:5784 length:903 start_codon:yes stop_codon:yes gene_type:complete
MKKILVTGATGQIGRVLIKKLNEERYEFEGLDIRPNEILSELKLLNFPLNDRKELVNHSEELKEFDTVIHLASKINIEQDVLKSSDESLKLNVLGTLNLLEFLPNLEHVVFTSTYMTYGNPVMELIDENHPTNPNNVYGASKLATEKFLQIFSNQRNIETTILRFMGVYGLEKPYNQAIPSFIKLISNDEKPIIFGDGTEKRNHIHVDDAVNSIITSLQNKKSGIFNIGGKDSPNNLELIEMINQEFNKEITPKFEDSKNKQYSFVTDISKAKNELKFEPKINIKEGISKTVKSFLEIGW